MRVKCFELGGHSISVKYMETVRNPDDGAEIFGLCNPMQNTIHIATHMKGMKLSEDVLLHSLCHELSHFVMILMNEAELNQNEQFIDLLGGFFHQFLKTKKIKNKYPSSKAATKSKSLT